MAPAFDDDAYEILAKKKNVRLLTINTADTPEELGTETTSIYGGLLIQTRDDKAETPADMTVVTEVKPTEAQLKALAFAQTVVKHVKSNAIVVAQADQTLGIGAGQMNRIGSDYAAKHDIKAIIQPGGSIRDKDSIAKANEYGIAMVTTGVRHFRH